MTPKDQAPECANPGCTNQVPQTAKPRPGRPSRYCSEACGRAFRKLSGLQGESDHDAYAEQVADECLQDLQNIQSLIAAGQPLEALRQIARFDRELQNLTAATVQQSRGHKKKAADIASALNIGTDNVSRHWSVEATGRRQLRTQSRQRPPAPASPPVRAIPRQRPPRTAMPVMAARTRPPASPTRGHRPGIWTTLVRCWPVRSPSSSAAAR
ncbi:hypothetical protein ABZ819_39815 [Streptomyces venezuelae]|uniref:hypothetical protein n=1 Tax=Streptomyces venezuelae TaxID=54571 RepID=UPI00343BC322